jgi:pseudaminic acid cytidylyltransferase
MDLPPLSDRPIAIIPARGGSKRVPRKNIADLNGAPLVSYAIRTCLQSELFSRVIVSTEDGEIAAIAREYAAEVDPRPDTLAGDKTPATAVIKELLERNFPGSAQPDNFCLVYPMAAFLTVQDLQGSAAELARYDAVMGVSKYISHPYKALIEVNGHLKAMWPDLNMQQSQNYPETYASNGTFCWMRTGAFLECLSFYPERLHGYVLPEDRAVDIDTLEDLERARRLIVLNQT